MSEWFEGASTDEARHERSYLRRVVGVGLVGVVALVLTVVFATRAYAADTFRQKDQNGKDQIVIVLHDGQCSDKNVLEYLRDNILDDRRFKKAHVEWEGKTYGGCWIEVSGLVYCVSSDKQPIKPLPKNAFKDEAV